MLRKRSELSSSTQSIPFDTSDIAEAFPPVLLMAELPHDQNGRLTSEAFDSGKGSTNEEYFCRIGDDEREWRETPDNPLYKAYQSKKVVSSGLWDMQPGKWVLGVEIYVVLHDHKLYWCQRRPNFSTFLNLHHDKARRETFTTIKRFVHAENPIAPFTKPVFSTDLRAPPTPSQSTFPPVPRSYQDGVSFLQKWRFVDICPWKRCMTPVDLENGNLNHDAFSQKLLALSNDNSYQSRVLNGIRDLGSCLLPIIQGNKGWLSLKATGFVDENGVMCCYAKKMATYDIVPGTIFADLDLEGFLPLIEARENLKNIARSFMTLPLSPILKDCEKRPWAYYRTTPPLNSEGHPDFDKIRPVLEGDIDRLLLHLRHHYYEGNVRGENTSIDSSSKQPNYRWRWYLKGRMDRSSGTSDFSQRIESVQDSDKCPESYVRFVSLRIFAILLLQKNKKDAWPKSESTYTNFELLESMSSGYTCPTPPDPKGPYGNNACRTLKTIEERVDEEDADLVCSTSKTSDSREKKREN